MRLLTKTPKTEITDMGYHVSKEKQHSTTLFKCGFGKEVTTGEGVANGDTNIKISTKMFQQEEMSKFSYYSDLLFMISRNVGFLQQIQSEKCFLNIIN